MKGFRRSGVHTVSEAGGVQGVLGEVLRERTALIDERLNRLKQRASAIVPTNRLLNVTDASLGVVPLELLELAGDLN